MLLAGQLALVWWFTLRPASPPWVHGTNLRPLHTIRTDLAAGGWEAVAGLGGGLLLLAPLGVLLPLLAGRLYVSTAGSLARTVFAAAMLSLAVELLRTTIPGQVGDVDALLLNTAGVAVAHLAVVPAVRAALRRRTRAGGTRRKHVRGALRLTLNA
ncbi:VanZ family protein [Streptomyces polyrhachis]|uniref:VanZ family protein n=1 Tax=Streptomyces polyrhachis TaxID=1282885 RepID=A0ABW2G973_9ACTN